MEVTFDTLSDWEWEAFADTGLCGLQQRWSYGECLSTMGARVARVAVTEPGQILGAAQLIRRGPVALISRGPVWAPEVDHASRKETWRILARSLRRAGVRLMAITTPSGRGPGFQVMTPVTLAILPIDPPDRASLHGKWRNRLRAAENSGFSVIQRSNRPENLRWLFRADRAQQKLRGYRTLPQAFTENWLRHSKAQAITLEVRNANEPVAAMLFLLHGSTATCHIGWSGAQGRARHAHNLLLWRGVEVLASRGVRKLDLGTLDTVNAPGLARFKLGTGAVPHRLGGTWVSL